MENQFRQIEFQGNYNAWWSELFPSPQCYWFCSLCTITSATETLEQSDLIPTHHCAEDPQDMIAFCTFLHCRSRLAFATHHSLISIVHIKKFHKNWSPKRLAQHLTPWDIILTKGLKKWLQAWHISTSSTPAPHASVMKSKTSRDQDLGDKPPAASLCSVWSLGLRASTCQPPHGYKPLTNMGFVISQCPLPRAGHDPGIISHEEKRARFRPPASASGTSGKENTYELPLLFSLIFLRGT